MHAILSRMDGIKITSTPAFAFCRDREKPGAHRACGKDFPFLSASVWAEPGTTSGPGAKFHLLCNKQHWLMVITKRGFLVE